MAFEKLTYVVLDGEPGIITRWNGGSYVYENKDGKWVDSGSSRADLAIDGRVVDTATFRDMFPDLPLKPPLPNAA